ncbi:hypothetical protein JJJ17_00275 [Paracoccus caeni]|uniref:Glycosyl transferase CAP10 domain-containing protein n=1 Tax=Paracoccus caeni TaxID=657651 RepID=A0A934VY34_9RHOB|nr:glycosyl transferase family 90 [Paracoccus caeni]MBK4214350.1 hypothetical protein [Paracoccus caeni]
MGRKFFQIGFNKCGTTFIARLFQMNDIPVVHWETGTLAEDIAYSKLVGRKPLQRWADVTAFTDMESVRYLNMPVIEAFREFRFLDEQFPGSVFLLNTRNVEDWVISRYMHRDGTYARAYAQILGVDLGDLANIWEANWHAHLADCRAYFAGRPEFIEIDIDHAAPADYVQALSPWFDLRHAPNVPGKKRRAGYLPRLSQMLEAPTPAVEEREDVAVALAERARPAAVRLSEVGFDACSGHYARFDAAAAEVRDRHGKLMPLTRDVDGWIYVDPVPPVRLRLTSAVNDIAQATDREVYHLDLRPECWLGSGPDHPVPGPIIAPCRRAGAENVFLWPLPWLHRHGNDGFLGNPLRAEPDWHAKKAQLCQVTDQISDEAALNHRFIHCPPEMPEGDRFLSLVNSQSVILREESAWEVFWTGLFQPWQHFIPVERGGADLEDRLAWARAHPAECKAMTAKARKLCAALADPATRRRHLSLVLRDYRIASGQEV